jgi:hypothetical protein
MRSLDATQRPEYQQLKGNERLFEYVLLTKAGQELVGRMTAGQLWHCSMQIRMTSWLLSGTILSARKLRELRLLSCPLFKAFV